MGTVVEMGVGWGQWFWCSVPQGLLSALSCTAQHSHGSAGAELQPCAAIHVHAHGLLKLWEIIALIWALKVINCKWQKKNK